MEAPSPNNISLLPAGGSGSSECRKFPETDPPNLKGSTSTLRISGNKVDFSSVYTQLYPYGFFLARKYLSAEDAADILASVFIKLLLLPKNQFSNFSHIKALLRISIRNACFTHLRNEKNRSRKLREWGHWMGGENEESAEAVAGEIHTEKMQKIYAEIEKLPVRCKTVFKMSFLENYKNRQIADTLGISENTVKNQKVYGLKRIRIALLSFTLFFFVNFQ